jgi:hypothetical protein
VAKRFFQDWEADIAAAYPCPAQAAYEPPTPSGAPTDEELDEMADLVEVEVAAGLTARPAVDKDAPTPVVDQAAVEVKNRTACLDQLRLLDFNSKKYSSFAKGSESSPIRTTLFGYLKPYIRAKICLRVEWHRVALQLWKDCGSIDTVAKAFENPLHWDTHVSRAETTVYLRVVDAAVNTPEHVPLLDEGLLRKALTHHSVDKERVAGQVVRFSGSPSEKRMVLEYFPDRIVTELADNGAELADEDMADYSSADGENTGPQAAQADTGTGEPEAAEEANPPVTGPPTTTTATIAETPLHV